MLLKSLELFNYRNYRALNLDIMPRGAIITGDNGTGKTNLLEAVYYLAFGKSFRTSHDEELIRFRTSFFRLKGRFDKADTAVFISAAADKNNKIIKVNETALERVSELFGWFKTVYFSPADLEIIIGSPASRRLFLDQAISQYDTQYLETLREFRHILKQRNALLKSNYTGEEKKTWDRQFIAASLSLIKQRLDYLTEFTPILISEYNKFIHAREKVELKYLCSFTPFPGSVTEADLAKHLQKNEYQEKMAQRTLYGPHLDDLEFCLDGKKARNFASQGQARSLVIITRLVQAMLISRHTGQLPLLMFDDVLSELDQYRSKAILDLLQKDYQILIATPFLSHYSHLALPVIDLKKVL